MVSLSICIIAKNEEKNIGRCLNSVKDIADEIIVVDTGSTDNTVNIAKGYGSKIIYHDFNNDFATSRNVSFDNATKDYILYLDCDEELDKEDSRKIKKMLAIKENEKYEGFTLNLINKVNGEDGVITPSLRLIKNRKEYRFIGRIHEVLQPVIVKYRGPDCFFMSDIKFYHYGYDEKFANIELKSRRNLEILNSYSEEEKSGFYYYNLANEYIRVKDYEKAIGLYKKSMEFEDNNGYKIYVPVYMMNALIEQKKLGKAIKEGEGFLKLYPNNKDIHFLIGTCYLNLGMYKESLSCLIKYKEFSSVDYGYPDFKFSEINDIDKLIKDLNTYIKYK